MFMSCLRVQSAVISYAEEHQIEPVIVYFAWKTGSNYFSIPSLRPPRLLIVGCISMASDFGGDLSKRVVFPTCRLEDEVKRKKGIGVLINISDTPTAIIVFTGDQKTAIKLMGVALHTIHKANHEEYPIDERLDKDIRHFRQDSLIGHMFDGLDF